MKKILAVLMVVLGIGFTAFADTYVVYVDEEASSRMDAEDYAKSLRDTRGKEADSTREMSKKIDIVYQSDDHRVAYFFKLGTAKEQLTAVYEAIVPESKGCIRFIKVF